MIDHFNSCTMGSDKEFYFKNNEILVLIFNKDKNLMKISMNSLNATRNDMNHDQISNVCYHFSFVI